MQSRLNIALIVITALLLGGGVMASAETAIPCPHATAVMERVWQVYDGMTSFHGMSISTTILDRTAEVEGEADTVRVSHMELWFNYPRIRMDTTREIDDSQDTSTAISGLQTGFTYIYSSGQWSKTGHHSVEMGFMYIFLLCTDTPYTAVREEMLAGRAVWVVEGEVLPFYGMLLQTTWWVDQQTYFIAQMVVVREITPGTIRTTTVQWTEFAPHIAIPDEKFAVPKDVPLPKRRFMPFDPPTAPFPAPEFRAVDITGEEISLVDLRGKVVLLNFWASWCRPCIAKLPLIQQLYEQYAAGGLVIIGINLDRSERMMERILEDFNITFRQIFAQAKEIADLYGVVGTPETFLIDRQGVVRFLSLRHEDSLRAAIARLLAEQ